MVLAMGVTNAHAGRRPARAISGIRCWLVTVAASLATTYALDFIATSLGLLVVASGLLGGLAYAPALALLLASYLAWGAGLWAVLGANWDLLQRTGTSTNLLAKAAHDVTARLTASLRWRRAAAYAGNISTELAKEAPYYIGAGGAAAFSDEISATDAIVFLAGANVGAAAYGFALARGLRLFARRGAGGQGDR
jgi:hypothetical protein